MTPEPSKRDATTGPAPTSPRRKRNARRGPAGWERWLNEPRSAVLFVLFSVLLVGGVRKLLQARRARAAVARLDEPDVALGAIADAAEHGRAGLMALFRLLGEAESEPTRRAAGHALSVLWARDELIAEEEKALVRRGVHVHWKARRRYPRALRAPIPIVVSFAVPFLDDNGPGVKPENLEWSFRIVGARRASLEVFSPWVAGPGHAAFTLIPSDFETDGPHRLVLQARARTRGLTTAWEMELPHLPFSFEFDPRLSSDALLALPDASRAATFSRAVRLDAGGAIADPPESPTFLPLNETLSIRGVPALSVSLPLPCDLAHTVELEFSGVPGRFPAGSLTVAGQGIHAPAPSSTSLPFPLGPISPVPSDALSHPGPRPLRARLLPDPDLGWADPDVRSIWPEAIETDWVDVEIVRR